MNSTRQYGFSLLEIALSLFVLAFLFAQVPAMLGSINRMHTADPVTHSGDAGMAALVGFAVQHDRLPCPDSNGDGREDCDGARTGGFPFHTVGLGSPLTNSAGHALYYGVYQHANANLSALQSSYTPSLLSGASPVNRNALDLCQGLRIGLSGGHQPTEIAVRSLDGKNLISPAFVLVDPGVLDADRDGRLFDGLNASGMTFESAGRALDEAYDDRVFVAGFAPLSARLGCPQLLARVSASVRDANAAYDMERAYAFYRKFRDFGVDVRETNLDIANAKSQIATVNVAVTAALVATDLATGLSSASGAGAVAVLAVNTGIAVAMAVDEITSTAEDVDDKQEQLDTAREQLKAAEDAEASAEAYLNDAIDEALTRDLKGAFQ